jgi:hypothetical protein
VAPSYAAVEEEVVDAVIGLRAMGKYVATIVGCHVTE